jgi:hypothetical protein
MEASLFWMHHRKAACGYMLNFPSSISAILLYTK